MGFDIMATLNAMKEERDAEISAKIKEKQSALFEEASNVLFGVNNLFNPEKFLSDLKSFIEKKIAPEYFFDGDGIGVSFEKPDALVLASFKGVDYSFALQNSVSGEQKKYDLKIYAYPLKKRLKAYFGKIFSIMLSDEAHEKIYANLTENGDLEVKFITITQFMDFVKKNGIEATFCLDEKPESENHICRGIISRGKLMVFSSEKKLWTEEKRFFKAIL